MLYSSAIVISSRGTEVGYDAPVTHPDLYQDVAPLDEAAEPLRDTGVQVELSGGLPDTAAAPMKGHGELIGIAAALLILVLALMFIAVLAFLTLFVLLWKGPDVLVVVSLLVLGMFAFGVIGALSTPPRDG